MTDAKSNRTQTRPMMPLVRASVVYGSVVVDESVTAFMALNLSASVGLASPAPPRSGIAVSADARAITCTLSESFRRWWPPPCWFCDVLLEAFKTVVVREHLVAHARLLHDPPGAGVVWHRHGNDVVQAERPEPVGKHSDGRFARV